MGKIKNLLRKREIVVPQPEIEQKIEQVEKPESDAWNEFKSLCREYGVDYREVIAKCAWSYIEEDGIDDPIERLKDASKMLEDIEKVTSTIGKSESLKKVRETTEAVKEVSELRKALKEFGGGVTLADMMAIAKRLGFVK